ncbi:hypothetical protein JOD82_001739 [Paenibacillus sp. 1182]|nr:hypothetical protein [Paenibacillus sp. 1182]
MTIQKRESINWLSFFDTPVSETTATLQETSHFTIYIIALLYALFKLAIESQHTQIHHLSFRTQLYQETF